MAKSKGVIAKSVQDAGIDDRRYVEAKKPKEAVRALEMIADGASYLSIMDETGLGWEGLIALKHRHAGALDKRRQQLANDGFLQTEKIRYIADKKLNMLAEDDDALRKVSIKDLILAGAISQDKSFDAMGEGTKVTVEHKGGQPSIADAMKMIQEARNALQKEAVPVDVVEVGNDTV